MKNIKWIWLVLAIVLCVAPLSGCAGTEEQELIIYTWAEYIPDSVIQGFEEETGIRIIYNNFETNEEMLAKLETAKGGDYDLILASDYIIKLAADQGLVGELDKSKIENYKNIDPIYQGFFYDPENKYTVPYAPGIPLIVYNPETVTCEMTGYKSLWDESLKGRVAMMDTQRVVNGITLKTLGESFNTEDLDKIREAGEQLKALAPNIRLLSNDQTQTHLISGEVDAALLFTSQVAETLIAKPDFKVCYPEEGLGFGVDALFIPSNAPHADAAHKFLNYILQGEVGADISTQVWYLCPNQASYECLPEEFQNSLRIEASDITNGEFIQDVSPEAAAVHDEIYTEFKAACSN